MNSTTGLYTAAAAGLLLLAGPLGTRAGLWPFLIGFALLGVSFLLALIAIFVGVVGLIRSQSPPAAAAAVVAAAVIGLQLRFILPAFGAPPINDITTDLEDPPQFVGAAYDPAFVEQQSRAYPELQPLELAVSMPAAFDRALAAAEQLGWEIVERDPTRGHLRAVDTTFWFGFKDDVVVRIRETGNGSRIDVRSKSRVGRGDVGANARRIRAFLARVREVS